MRQDIVIIGAPRSGTNMLRDVLAQLDEIATWPCDEINYIWRHGNVRHPSDELTPKMARPEIRRFIRASFDWVAQRYDAPIVVEKTCANSLRVPFVDTVLPEARYLFIRRDGLDAVGSAMQRWKAPLDLPYLARKARFVPVSDLPYYASRYLWNRVYRLLSRQERLAFWGPMPTDLDALLAAHPLDEVCAIQWQRCVDQAYDALQNLPPSRWLEVAYEDFVTDPERELDRVLAFLELEVNQHARRLAVQGVHGSSVGKGRAALDDASITRLTDLVGSTLERFGYPSRPV